MSSATPSHPASLPATDRSIVASWTDRLTYGIRATAFWGAAILPIIVIVMLAVGSIGQSPVVLTGALMLNAICAVVGHDHTPGR